MGMFDVSRRGFLRLAGSLAAVGPLGAARGLADPLPPDETQSSYYPGVFERYREAGIRVPEGPMAGFSVSLGARYLTDPERISRMLPPRLDVDERPEIHLFWYFQCAMPGRRVIFVPNWVYAEGEIMVTCRYEGHRCMLPLSVPLDQDFGRYAGREEIIMRKKDGRCIIEVDGRRIRGWISRRGRLCAAIETEFTDEPGHPYFNPRESGWGWMEYNFRLNPDWTQGLVAEDAPVRLYRAFGCDDGFPSDMPDTRFWPKMARACDVKKTRVTVGPPNPLDFFGEFPVREILGVNFNAPFVLPDGYEDPGPILVPRGPEKKLDSRRNTMTLLEEIPEEEFAPWIFSGKAYDRPITRCQVWVPDGWPETRTAVKMTESEVTRYRSREALSLEPADIADIELEIDAAKHAHTLPPPLRTGSRPRIRILAVRAQQNDYSTLPYTEFWLFSRCEYQDRPCWRALAHIVSFDGDVMYGRETFGYPSKHGEPEMTVGPMQVDLLGRRCMRDFLYATIPLSLDAPQKIEERFEFLGIRTVMLRNFEDYDSEDFGNRYHATARYITQPWSLEIPEARSAWPEQVHLVLPDEPGIGRIGRPDPWYEFSDARVVRCVAGRGAIRRFPGCLRGEFDWENHHRYLADHYESEDNNAIRPSTVTFLAGDTGS